MTISPDAPLSDEDMTTSGDPMSTPSQDADGTDGGAGQDADGTDGGAGQDADGTDGGAGQDADGTDGTGL
jgi:hypothetical protein